MNDLSARPESASTAIAAFVPRSINELIKFSELLSRSNLVPKDFVGKEADIFVAIQWGMEIGLQPMQALQSIAVINGRPSLWGDAGLALVYGSGLVESFEEEIGAESCTCRTKRKGNSKETVRTFTKDDAVKAELWGKGTYAKYPKRMLQMRARWWALRDAYTDVLRGVHGAEEMLDVEIDVTEQGSVVEQPRAKSENATKSVEGEVVDPLLKGGDHAATNAKAGRIDKNTGEVSQDTRPEPARKAHDNGFTTAAPAANEGKGAGDGKPLLEGQLRVIRGKMKNAALSDADLVAKFGTLEGLRFDQFEEIQAWISERASKLG